MDLHLIHALATVTRVCAVGPVTPDPTLRGSLQCIQPGHRVRAELDADPHAEHGRRPGGQSGLGYAAGPVAGWDRMAPTGHCTRGCVLGRQSREYLDRSRPSSRARMSTQRWTTHGRGCGTPARVAYTASTGYPQGLGDLRAFEQDLRCVAHGPSAHGDPALVAAIDAGIPGASARREFERRQIRREQAVGPSIQWSAG